MKGKMFVSSLLASRNIAVLLVAAGAILLLGNMVLPIPSMLLYGTGFAVYLGFVLASMGDSRFQEKFFRKQKIKEIQNMNYACLKMANQAKKTFRSDYLLKLKKVMADKDDIINSFFKGEYSYLKEKIVEQTLKLVVSYIRLSDNFIQRNKEAESVKLSDIAERLNSNTRRLSFERDPITTGDLRKSIEMDEKLLEKLKEERVNLERTKTKLNYMETTINMFKHQILSHIESEEMLSELETAVNEAEALESVLTERRKGRVSL